MSGDSRDAARATLLNGLRELPQRRAPLTLQSRVLHVLAQRAALPWWRRGYAAWPTPARVLFLLGCALLAIVPAFASSFYTNRVAAFDVAAREVMSWARPALAAYSAVSAPAAIVVHSIPAAWLTLLLAVVVLLYAVLFALGAAAYHVLSFQPSNTFQPYRNLG